MHYLNKQNKSLPFSKNLRVLLDIWGPGYHNWNSDEAMGCIIGGFDSCKRLEIFLFSKNAQTSCLAHPGFLFPQVTRPGQEADHLPPSSAEVKKEGANIYTPYTPAWYTQGQLHIIMDTCYF